MQISKHIGKVREGIDSALSLADDATKDVASRVASAAEPSLRLALIDAVTEAASEINDELTASEVTVSLTDGDPTFVVIDRPYEFTRDDSNQFEFEDDGEDDTVIDAEVDEEDPDETLVRFSLRLPKWAKDKVDERAERRGMSTNAYLTEVVISEIAGGRDRGFGPGRFGGPPPPPGKGWGPGGFIPPEAAAHIARVVSEFLGEDPRQPGAKRPGGPRHGGPPHGDRRRGGYGERRGPRDGRDPRRGHDRPDEWRRGHGHDGPSRHDRNDENG